jgi:DNA polymerase III alpha subunit
METIKKLIEEKKQNYSELVSHPNFEKRIRWELIEIDVQDEEQYFLDLVSENKKLDNPHNLLVPVLLGICDKVDLDKDPAYKFGDFPDVDVDYLPIVRDYLKNEWAPREFGADNVCSIGNYGTFGLKSSLIDMVRVHGLDRGEMLAITTRMGLKDDDGQALTLDKALEMYPDLKQYLQNRPEIEVAVRKLLHRNRSMGKHAGGLIICNNRIDNFVPLVRGTDGNPVSAWVEGLHGQDLGPVGLIKFDLLVVDGLYQIALATKMVKERHKLDSLCALPGDWDWSDVAYLNDPASLEMANNGDMRCIFQFDSDGIRSLVMKGGVSHFDDLVAYVSLYRPSALDVKMDEEYILRKRGKKEYEIPEILKPHLSNSYGVLIYQENIMQVLSIVGKIPMRDCYQVIKAISKKKLSAFIKYKDKFIENGQQTLGWTKKQMEEYWQLIEAFSRYGFNLAHATSYSYLSSRQLYLKSHYPIEFFTSSLINQDNDDKKREYITEAINHGVEVCELDINKSKETFSIVDEKIYIGFSNIKGIGEEKAKKIVETQPYISFQDFLDRYGTEANVVKALLGLRVFKEADPIILYKFWEKYTEYKKQVKDREKRFEATRSGMLQDMCDILPEDMRRALSKFPALTKEIMSKVIEYVEKRGLDELKGICAGIKKKLDASYTRFETNGKKVIPPNFDTCCGKEVEIDDEKMIPLLKSKDKADIAFYGFIWENKVKQLKDYKPGFNWEQVKFKAINRPMSFYSVMGFITQVHVQSMKNGGKFANVSLADDNFEENKVVFWDEDRERFQEELKAGNCISIQVVPSNNGRPGYVFYGPPKHQRYKLPKKNLDYRLIVLES